MLCGLWSNFGFVYYCSKLVLCYSVQSCRWFCVLLLKVGFSYIVETCVVFCCSKLFCVFFFKVGFVFYCWKLFCVLLFNVVLCFVVESWFVFYCWKLIFVLMWKLVLCFMFCCSNLFYCLVVQLVLHFIVHSFCFNVQCSVCVLLFKVVLPFNCSKLGLCFIV